MAVFRLLVVVMAALALLPVYSLAQPRPRAPTGATPRKPQEGRAEAKDDARDSTEDASDEDEDAEYDDENDDDDEQAPRLRAPAMDMPAVGAERPIGDGQPSPQSADEPSFLSPGEAADRLSGEGPLRTDSDPLSQGNAWTSPQTVFSLHGYLRVRGEHQDGFSLGRQASPGRSGDPPFDRWVPIESRDGIDVQGGCGSSAFGSNQCDTEALSYANMRLGLIPEINLSDDVRIKAYFDVFDNMVLGSTPHGFNSGVPFTDLQATSNTQLPPGSGRNSLQDSIVARRAWAEVRNRALGELRFGRMGFDWGLGMVFNGGEGLDDDFSTEVDRLMGITKLAGLYFMAAYDFASEGFINQTQHQDLRGLPIDAGQRDDVDQFMFAVAKRHSPTETKEKLANDEVVLNAGLLFTYRSQFLSSEYNPDALNLTEPIDVTSFNLVRRNYETFNPDVWIQFLYKALRLEMEASLNVGSVENVELDAFNKQDFTIFQMGLAFESELRLLSDKLGLYLYGGFASGDSDVDGLALTNGHPPQQPTLGVVDDTISTFRMHPNYRVDLILWRNIMQQVAGAYYIKPGVSYDFIRGTFGQLLGARLDLIWSRASSALQTWGNDPDLGLELNASLYYRSEDGPELTDGFYALVQYGLLFPFAGLGYLPNEFPGGNPGLENAFTFRALMGVVF